jgi:hypothetical protein
MAYPQFNEPSWLQDYIAEQKANAGSFGQRYLQPFEQAAVAGIGAYKSGEKSNKIKEIIGSSSKEIDDSIANVMKEIADLENRKKSIQSKIALSQEASKQIEGYKPNVTGQMEGYKPNPLTREPAELNTQGPVVLDDYFYTA